MRILSLVAAVSVAMLVANCSKPEQGPGGSSRSAGCGRPTGADRSPRPGRTARIRRPAGRGAAPRARPVLRALLASAARPEPRGPRVTRANPAQPGRLARQDSPGPAGAANAAAASNLRGFDTNDATFACNADETVVSALCKGGGTATLQGSSANCTGGTGIAGICMKK